MFIPKKRTREGPPSYVLHDMQRIHMDLNFQFGFDILDGGRKRQYVDARRVFANILDAKYDLKTSKPFKILTLTDVGNYIGCNHASVINLLRNFDVLCSWDPRYRQIYEETLTRSSDDFHIRKESLIAKRTELIKELEQVEQHLKLLDYDFKEKFEDSSED